MSVYLNNLGHKRYEFDNGYGASVINQSDNNGLFEVALLENERVSDITGYCTIEDVTTILLEIKSLPNLGSGLKPNSSNKNLYCTHLRSDMTMTSLSSIKFA
jgi:hypothetical protein